MLRGVEPLNREIKQIENRRDQVTRKHALEVELISARNAEAQQVRDSKK
jgi:hypothetical protein